MSETRKPLAVVIGSGSVKCAAAIGLMNVLRREGIEPGMVVGCSGGAMYAALIALGYKAEEIATITRTLWTPEVTARRSVRDMLSVLLPGPLDFSEHFGLTDDTLVLARLREAYGERTFRDARIPLFITATDFANGEQVVLREGKLADAIRASIAIPYVFKPHRVDGRLLVDGYLSDPLPVGVAIREGAGQIIAIGFDAPYQTRVNSLMRFSFQISSIMSNNLYKANYAFHNLAHHGEIMLVAPQFEVKVGLFDTEKIPYIIEAGERAAQEQVPYLRRVLNP